MLRDHAKNPPPAEIHPPWAMIGGTARMAPTVTNGSGGDGAGRGRVALGYWVQPDDRDPEAVQVLLDGTRPPSPVGLPPFAYSSVQDDLGLRVPSEVPDEVLVESGLGARDDDQVADQARLAPRSAAPQIA